MERELVQLSKTISKALRHTPWLYELELDEQGWVGLSDLLEAIRQRAPHWQNIGEAEVIQIMLKSDKQRFEVKDGRIRAFYGHSIPGKLAKEQATPPEILYHGTNQNALSAIRATGLQPMKRQYVHLSMDETTAQLVAGRKAGRTIILKVQAGQAHRQGLKFYLGNEMVWLADSIPPEFLIEADE